MNFIVTANTDIGISKATNQDSVLVKKINTIQGEMVFAVLCDGMGGLDKGEVASASVIRAFDNWLMNSFPAMCSAPIEDSDIRAQWVKIITEQNERIKAYGGHLGIYRLLSVYERKNELESDSLYCCYGGRKHAHCLF